MADFPIPAMPPRDLASAVRAGWAEGRVVLCGACVAAGVATAAGDAAIDAWRVLRAGDFVGWAIGLIVGTLASSARRVAARATWLDELDDGASCI